MSIDTDVTEILDGVIKCPSCGDGLDNCELRSNEEGDYYRCKGCGSEFTEDGEAI